MSAVTDAVVFRLLALPLLLVLVSGCASVPRTVDRPAAVPAWDAGFVASGDRTLHGEGRVRAAGPLYESQASTNGMTFGAVRPFYSVVTDPARERTNRDLLWPVGHIRNTRTEREWHFLLGYGIDWDRDDPLSRYRFWVVPIAFSGRDREGERYHALFPVGGNLREFLGRDRISFVLWPIYAHAVTKDLESHHIVWPIVSWSKGDTEHGYRVFPLYGHYTDEGRLSKRFVLWPIWTSVQYEYPKEKGSGFILFPLFGHVRTTRQNGWMFLPPFFRWSKSEDTTQANLPWPIVHYTRGKTVRKVNVWPLWGTRSDKHIHRTYVLWPISRFDRLERADGEYRQGRVLPFFYYDSLRTPTNRPSAAAGGLLSALLLPAPASTSPAPAVAVAPGTVRARYVKLWPLFTYRRDGDTSLFGTLALWPLKQSPAIERNWAPIWTFYRVQREGAAREEELLWGLWRRTAGADGSRRAALFPLFASARAGDPAEYRRWSVLGGLYASERKGLKKRVRLLYWLSWESNPARAGSEPPATAADDRPEGH
ncbi:MAG: hypothetical protein K8T26_05690 [Lentisphaerae bacterium]|nr:hypothetical protein [Lentisphaerota bacterium]